MAVRVTENWRSEIAKGQRATRTFLVTGVSTVDDALAAVGVPDRGDAHPADASMIAFNTPSVLQLGPDRYEVTVGYTTEASNSYDDPEDTTPRVRLAHRLEEVPIDTDINDNPIVNSAGQPFASAPTGKRLAIDVEVTRFQSSFSLATARSYAGAVNNDTWTVAGVTMGAQYEAMCLAITPANAVPLDAATVQVVYRFLVIPGADMRFARIADLGTVGLAIDDNGDEVVEPIYTRAEGSLPEQVTTEVPLNGFGQPFKVLEYQVGINQFASPSPAASPPGATREAQTNAVWLKYQINPLLAFNSLGL